MADVRKEIKLIGVTLNVFKYPSRDGVVGDLLLPVVQSYTQLHHTLHVPLYDLSELPVEIQERAAVLTVAMENGSAAIDDIGECLQSLPLTPDPCIKFLIASRSLKPETVKALWGMVNDQIEKFWGNQ